MLVDIIAFKFPQFQFLGSHVKAGEGTWNEAASRSKKGFNELKRMENLFLCYHGEKFLKPGKDATKILTSSVCQFVELPEEAVASFVRCRMFCFLEYVPLTKNKFRLEVRKGNRKN